LCCSHPIKIGEIARIEDFKQACRYIGVPYTHIKKPEAFTQAMNRKDDLKEFDLSRFDVVLTHGNWGHPHHRSIHKQVTNLYRGPIICHNPKGEYKLTMSDSLYKDKIEYLKNYKINSVKIGNVIPEKWRALLHYYKYLQERYEGFDIVNTVKTLNIYKRSWGLTPGVECDIHMAEYIDNNGLSNKTIFHFGTGSHHKLAKMTKNNSVLGITASVEEYSTYIQEAINHPELAKRYKVMFGDIYTLDPQILPQFDIVTLFHLCEYSRSDCDYGQMNDEELLDVFINKLKPNGLICFFTGSNHYKQALELIQSRTDIKKISDYKSITVYKRTP
jgi:hypothetical protein